MGSTKNYWNNPIFINSIIVSGRDKVDESLLVFYKDASSSSSSSSKKSNISKDDEEVVVDIEEVKQEAQVNADLPIKESEEVPNINDKALQTSFEHNIVQEVIIETENSAKISNGYNSKPNVDINSDEFIKEQNHIKEVLSNPDTSN